MGTDPEGSPQICSIWRWNIPEDYLHAELKSPELLGAFFIWGGQSAMT